MPLPAPLPLPIPVAPPVLPAPVAPEPGLDEPPAAPVPAAPDVPRPDASCVPGLPEAPCWPAELSLKAIRDAVKGGPPEYVAKNGDRLTAVAQTLADLATEQRAAAPPKKEAAPKA